MDSSIQAIYTERIDRFNLAFKRDTPDRVPILFMSEMWPVHHCGLSAEKVLKNPLLFYKAFEKTFSEIYIDGLYGLGNLWIKPVFDALNNSGSYKLTDGIVNYEDKISCYMDVNDYNSLIKNPCHYILNEFFPKKFKVLESGDATSAQALEHAYNAFVNYRQANLELIDKTENVLGIPIFARTLAFSGPDMLLDYFRGFEGIITDINRIPQLFLKASSALNLFITNIKMRIYNTPEDGHFILLPLHLGSYLKPKDFEKYYLPFLNQLLEMYTKNNYTVCLFFENDWTPYLEYFDSFPDGKILGIFEYGDLSKIKKKVGNKICIIGGMPISQLSYGTEKECIDTAKRIIDECAPGGGYIFSTDKILLSLDDGCFENIRAVHEFVYDYAKY